MRKRYSIGEFAKRIGRSPQTIRRWETEGKLQPKRLPSGIGISMNLTCA